MNITTYHSGIQNPLEGHVLSFGDPFVVKRDKILVYGGLKYINSNTKVMLDFVPIFPKDLPRNSPQITSLNVNIEMHIMSLVYLVHKCISNSERRKLRPELQIAFRSSLLLGVTIYCMQ